VEIVFFSQNGGSATSSLVAGNSLVFNPNTSTINAPLTNTETVVVVIDGEEFPLAPGEEVTVPEPSIEPPVWSVRNIDLFQDTFPTNGTSIGTGRIDIANDIGPSASSLITPGDSAVVMAYDSTLGIKEPADYGCGPAVFCNISVSGPSAGSSSSDIEAPEEGICGSPATGLLKRYPVVGSTIVGSRMWHVVQMDTCFDESSGPRTGPVPNMYCVDLNDNWFTNGDTLLFYFWSENTANQKSYWSEFTGTTLSEEEAALSPMEMQILPGEGVANGGDILYVDNFSGHGARYYFDTAFEILGISDEVDRFDKRGPSLLVGNALGHRASLTQLHDNYRKIIWNSGDLSVGTVSDGTVEKADDYAILFAFLDLHPDPNGAGIYFSGDNLAQELSGMTSVSSQNFKNIYMPHVLITGNHTTIDSLFSISPFGIGESAGTGVPPSFGVFDHGPPFNVDTIVVYGGYPIINDFDVIAPVGSATLEMCYNPEDEADDSNPAVIAFSTLNYNGYHVATVLSGFSFHYIRDDYPNPMQPYPDRADHLRDILAYLGNPLDDPTVVKPVVQYTNSLAQNYPNPFNPSTTIKYSIREQSHVSLRIYSVTGQLVKTLVNEEKIPDVYTLQWNGENNEGNRVASGVYFYRLVTNDFKQTRKLIMLK
jgi:hypothetical protein